MVNRLEHAKMRRVRHFTPLLGFTSPSALSLSTIRIRCKRSLCELSAGSSPGYRRRNVGKPKGVDTGEAIRTLTAEESPWEDYLIPTLRGNTTPKHVYERPFYVLGVESSCDDTAAAIVKSDGTILSDVRVGQEAQTAEWGGVVPHVAREAHEQAIERVIVDALNEAGMHKDELHAVAATMGPGLEVCLRVGYRAARAVARETGADFIAVNHLEAHLLVARLGNDVRYPFLALLVSGGHCQLLLVRGVAEYAALGGTLDDALGEAYDKTARLLGIEGACSGAALEQVAKSGDALRIPFPVPMRKRADCNFSFAGLKTSVRTAVRKLGGIESVRADQQLVADFAASFQHIAVTHLEQRTRRAIRKCKALGVDTLVVSGGVAANQVVRSRLNALAQDEEVHTVFPPVRLCTDNGVMVAWAGVERLRVGIATDTKNLDVRARWPLAALVGADSELVAM